MPSDARYSFPSWNLRSFFAGMHTDYQMVFATATPLKIRSNGFGPFTVDVAGVRGGGFSMLELSGSQATKQLLEFKGLNGAMPGELRLNVVRVQ